jgi:hypothetical protein
LVLENYDRLMDGARADLVITDLPWNFVIDGHDSGFGRVRRRELAMDSGDCGEQEHCQSIPGHADIHRSG